MYCYDQSKRKLDIHEEWKIKRNEKFDQRKKGFKPFHFQNQQMNPSQSMTNLARVMEDMPRDTKEIVEPLQYSGCGGNHILRKCVHRNGNVS